jgi:hypothetical protein
VTNGKLRRSPFGEAISQGIPWGPSERDNAQTIATNTATVCIEQFVPPLIVRETPMDTTEIVMRFVSTLIFAGLGYVVSRRVPLESKITAWVVFVLGAVLASDGMRNVWIIAIDKYAIYLNSSLYGLGLGILMGFLAKKTSQPANADTKGQK